MRFTKRLLLLISMVVFPLFGNLAQAGPVPYANVHHYNDAAYTFVASSTGYVMAYFVGGKDSSYTNEVGLLINGKLSSAGYGLNNHASNEGQAFNLGNVNAGDVLTFVLHNLAFGGENAYSDPSLNVAYDQDPRGGHNHIYSSSYTPNERSIGALPAGVYVAFEDLRFPNADFDYNDESFVFTNVATNRDPTVPEPATLALLGVGLAALGIARRRRS